MSESESPAQCSYEGCTRYVHGDADQCIFHAPADKKDPRHFRKALAAQIRRWRREKARMWDFTGWVFVDVDRKPKSQRPWEKFNFFRRAMFPVNADFGGAKFESPVYFILSKFCGWANFGSAAFSGDANFGATAFLRYANFRSAVFSGDVYFETAFSGQAFFGSATFSGDADFESAQFTGDAEFRSAAFSGVANFLSAAFSGDASFQLAAFSGDANFESATFSADADFESAQFTGDADFVSAQFTGYANFRSAQFAEIAYFTSAQFMEEANFFSAQFTQDAYFSFAQFTENADFYSVKFTEDANFNSARFTKTANFGSAEFEKILDLEYASFGTLGDFAECRIHSHVELIWPGEGKTRIHATKGEEDKNFTAAAVILRGKLLFKNLQFDPCGVLDLSQNSLAPDCELAIEDCDMSRILLEGTDCTKIRFYNCQWPVALGRAMVGDEWLARFLSKRNRSSGEPRPNYELPEWRLIETTYQQLAKRFREDFNHSTANDFDCGVFEMRRLGGYQRKLKEGKPRGAFQKKWLSLVALYRYLSNYSSNFWLPLIWLAVVIPSWAAGYCLTTRPNIHDNCAWSFWDYLGLSLQVSYLNRSGLDFARGNSILVNVLMALQVVLTATLVALFIFAIRRRFRHG